MSDAWDTLVAVSTTGDAWERLTDITGGTCTGIGVVVDELRFVLQPVIQLQGQLAVSQITGDTSVLGITGSVAASSINGSAAILGMSGVISIQEM